MNAQERELLTSFLTNLGATKVPSPDQEALSMIRNAVAGQPDAAYLLVQQALVQQSDLRQAQTRIAALEEKIRSVPVSDAHSSFLGGTAGGGWSNPPAPAAMPGGTFGGGGAAAAQAVAAPPPSPSMGGFLRGAATTAAGVAGGALLFQGLEHLLGGHQGGGFLGGQAPIAGVPEIIENNTVINEYLGADPAADPNATLLGAAVGDDGGAGADADPFADPNSGVDADLNDDPADWA